MASVIVAITMIDFSAIKISWNIIIDCWALFRSDAVVLLPAALHRLRLRTKLPEEDGSTRLPDILALYLYSGIRRWCVIHLYLCQWYTHRLYTGTGARKNKSTLECILKCIRLQCEGNCLFCKVFVDRSRKILSKHSFWFLSGHLMNVHQKNVKTSVF